MNIALPVPSSAPDAPLQRGRFIRVASIGVLAVTAVNLGLYAIGRSVDASFLMEAAYGTPAHHIVASDVALKTLIPLALGMMAFALIAQNWSRWTSLYTAVGVGSAISSGLFAFLRAHDATTGVLIATMHTVAGITLWVVASRSRARGHMDERRLRFREARQAK